MKALLQKRNDAIILKNKMPGDKSRAFDVYIY